MKERKKESKNGQMVKCPAEFQSKQGRGHMASRGKNKKIKTEKCQNSK